MWQEKLLSFWFFRQRLSHGFWKWFRQERCKVLEVALYTIAKRVEILVVKSEVIKGPFAGKRWEMMARYDPTRDAESRADATEVKRQIRDLAEQSNVEVTTANFYYWSEFFDHFKGDYPKLSKLADPSKSDFTFVVLW